MQRLVEFEKYKQIPEYQLQNMGMSMSEFKFIYWWEWGHRQLGRFIGLVWALGICVLLLNQKSHRLDTLNWLLGALGGLQGAIGWWMVHSGLGGEDVGCRLVPFGDTPWFGLCHSGLHHLVCSAKFKQ